MSAVFDATYVYVSRADEPSPLAARPRQGNYICIKVNEIEQTLRRLQQILVCGKSAVVASFCTHLVMGVKWSQRGMCSGQWMERCAKVKQTRHCTDVVPMRNIPTWWLHKVVGYSGRYQH